MIDQTTDSDSVKLGGSRFAIVCRECWRLARPILIALFLFFTVRALVLEAFKIPTSSMEKALLPGDFVLVNKAVFGSSNLFGLPGVPGWENPKRRDVVVFQPPHDPGRNYVKRVIGLPGDTVEMRDGDVFINGMVLVEDYLENHTKESLDVRHLDMDWQKEHIVYADTTQPDIRQSTYRPSRDNWGPLYVPGHKFFVLGDNRDDSEDSRYWGFVSRDSMEGKAWLIYYSVEPGYEDFRSWVRSIRWERVARRIE